MTKEYKRIIWALIFLVGIYLCMVSFMVISDYRAAHDSYHYSWEKTSEEMGVWVSAGTFLLMTLSVVIGYSCALGIMFQLIQYVKSKM